MQTRSAIHRLQPASVAERWAERRGGGYVPRCLRRRCGQSADRRGPRRCSTAGAVWGGRTRVGFRSGPTAARSSIWLSALPRPHCSAATARRGATCGPSARAVRCADRHSHLEVIVRVVRLLPPILVPVWAVEYPRVLAGGTGRGTRVSRVAFARARAVAHSRNGGDPGGRGLPWAACSAERRGDYQPGIWTQSDLPRRGAYLANDCASEPSARRPFEFCHSVLFVCADGSPERRHGLALTVRVGLCRGR